MKIDLRSDTVTKPSKEMLSAMMTAPVGDDVYGEDPSVKALESYLCELFGMSKALFFPSGTMANQAAIKLHTQPGEQLIADRYSHIFHYEGGGVSFNSGVSCKLLSGNRGRLAADLVEGAINPPDFYHSPKTSLVSLENTTNKGGGACYDFNEFQKIKDVCKQNGLGLHLDGARLWNAMEVTKEAPKTYGALFDTISVCLSKGLGAPIGSVLIGNAAIMENALRVRKLFGGAMRQVGFMAAAGLYAVKHNRSLLIEDHKKAKELAQALRECKKVIKVEPVDTNIIIFYTTEPEKVVIAHFAELGIHFYGLGEGKLRLVTHLDYTDEMHEKMLLSIKVKLN